VVDCVQRRENSSQLLDGGDFLETQVLGYLLDGALARHQHVLIMELVEHPQRRVRHHHLILIDLKNKFQFYKKLFVMKIVENKHRDCRHNIISAQTINLLPTL
jgi:hypothetical protein